MKISDEATEEYDFGWLFYVNSRQFLETGDINYRLVGAGPIFVEAYRATGDPHAEREPTLRVSVEGDAQVDRRKLAMARRSIAACSLSEALAWADRCPAGEEECLDFGRAWEAREELERAKQQLQAPGVAVNPRWRGRT